MNTPAHLIVGAAAFGKDHKTAWAALLGALVPDLSLYLMAAHAIFVAQIPESVVFNELYFSDSWQQVFAIDNSFLIWGALLMGGIVLTLRPLIAFAGAGVLHLAADFLLHHDDGRRHFWPLSDWVFESPLSYWDSGHHALWVGPVLAVISALCVLLLWRRLRPWGWRVLFGVLLLLELNTLRSWVLYF